MSNEPCCCYYTTTELSIEQTRAIYLILGLPLDDDTAEAAGVVCLDDYRRAA